MSTIAITGASGFVGRHVAPLLLAQGHQIRGLVRLGSEAPTMGEESETMRGDVRSLAAVRSLVQSCDLLLHLAASFSSQDNTAEIVLTGTRNVVLAAQEAGLKRLVFVSCLGADASAEAPFYAAKWKAETLVRGSNVPYAIVRPSLVLGRDDGVLRPLATIIRSWPVVPVPGQGQLRQQPIDVDDFSRCLVAALTDDTLIGETVSVGGPMFITFRELIDLVAGQLGVYRPKVLVPPRWLPALSRLLPPASRALYLHPRVGHFQQGVVASPGIVQRTFGFEPASVLAKFGYYLA
jgi:NADH dehydrogenase